MDLPLLRKDEFYPMVWGVRETEIPLGMRSQAQGNVYYVDFDHALANDDNTGVDPDHPLKTIQQGVLNAEDFDTVIVRSINPDGESVIVLPWASNVNLIGAGVGRYSPLWTPSAGNDNCIVLLASNWKISGFRFFGADDDHDLVYLYGSGHIISDNYFDGGTSAFDGIVVEEDAENIWIVNNWFSLFHNAINTSYAIWILEDAQGIFVLNNAFMDNDNNIVSLGYECFILNNVVQQVGYSYTATKSVDTSAGDNNIVSQNIFEGDYDTAYFGNLADMWVGNKSCDITSGLVGDNGITVATNVPMG